MILARAGQGRSSRALPEADFLTRVNDAPFAVAGLAGVLLMASTSTVAARSSREVVSSRPAGGLSGSHLRPLAPWSGVRYRRLANAKAALGIWRKPLERRTPQASTCRKAPDDGQRDTISSTTQPLHERHRPIVLPRALLPLGLLPRLLLVFPDGSQRCRCVGF